MNSLQSLIDQMTAAKQRIKNEGTQALRDSIKEFFVRHPEAKSIVWTQYTPYFNDGDACTFSVNTMELKVHIDKVSEDAAKLIEKICGDDNESDGYGYGSSCAAEVISYFSDERSYYSQQINELGLKHRDLTPQESSLVEDFEELTEALQGIPEILEMVLGDHVMVVASPDNISVTEHEHD